MSLERVEVKTDMYGDGVYLTGDMVNDTGLVEDQLYRRGIRYTMIDTPNGVFFIWNPKESTKLPGGDDGKYLPINDNPREGYEFYPMPKQFVHYEMNVTLGITKRKGNQFTENGFDTHGRKGRHGKY